MQPRIQNFSQEGAVDRGGRVEGWMEGEVTNGVKR